MRFSTLVAAVTLMVTATTAFADPDAAPVAGEVIQRKRPAPQQPPAEQPPAPREAAPPPAAEDYGDYDGGEEPQQNTTIVQNNTVIENREYNEGAAGQFYVAGYGGIPAGFVADRCLVRGVGVDPQFGPMVIIVGVDRWNRAYKMLPTPIPAQARFEALNGMRLNGVCPGAPIQPQYVVPNGPPPPVFLPYRGQVRPPVVFNNYPQHGNYGPRPGYGRPNGPYAAPPRGFLHP